MRPWIRLVCALALLEIAPCPRPACRLLSTASAAQAPAAAEGAGPSGAERDAAGVVPAIIAGPCLQNPGEDSMTVVWMTDGNCAGWVEYGEAVSPAIERNDPTAAGGSLEDRAVSSRDGLIDADRRLHRVTIRGLAPGTSYRYRVVSRAIVGFEPYRVTYGETAASEVRGFTTLDARKPEFSFIVLNDLHDKVDIMERLIALAAREPYDLVILNGDIINDPQDEEQVIRRFLLPFAEAFASRIPLVFVRGNHETRGRYARDLRPFIRDAGEAYQGAFTHGGVRFVVLDSGEDKADEEPVYAGLVDFDRYRSAQRRWLAREIRGREFREARFRVGITHIPLFGSGQAHAATDCREKWGPLLDAGGIDLHISGHLHRHRILDPEPGLHDYPVVIGGAPRAGAATLARVDVTPDELRVRLMTDDGMPAGSITVPYRERDRGFPLPSENRPLAAGDRARDGDARAMRLLRLEVEEALKAPPGEVEAHPAAREFPGMVREDARRVGRIVAVETDRPGWHNAGIYGNPRSPYWHGTGLYAAPGEVITVTRPPEAAGKGLHLRIGAHSDRLWRSPSWKRAPEICRRFPLDETTVRAANAFGGLIYIEVPFDLEVGTLSLRIDGAVEAPRYVLGETSLDAWRSTARRFPSPWAELETRKVILTIPSQAIRELDDPEGLMRFWDEILDCYARLLGRSPERRRPERFVADIQIGAGYMHSGYPLMTMLDIVPVMVSKERIAANDHHGVWGLFHEIGHNHQRADWTFDGTIEVTVNLFSLHVMETICGIAEDPHPAVRKEARERSVARYLEGGARFAEWKRDPFLALAMYIQLKDAFGWDAFTKVFTEYRELPEGERPRTDDEKRDQWFLRFSRTVGRNLGPFFETWGVPVSRAARDAVAELPAWMPEGFPPKPGAIPRAS
ncbi:MAG: M60 family metallopeptidase [Planctomycetes bacterium]|nr:M60 family metallopeptidase [Planctomycetota bacterium]